MVSPLKGTPLPSRRALYFPALSRENSLKQVSAIPYAFHFMDLCIYWMLCSHFVEDLFNLSDQFFLFHRVCLVN
ncbi:hypothetical protein PDESU_06179 [Pontiella desulfatans]|uniref:Uncharacterized protein n=1 Tax=Pontiella desulfatans TaxID=2750659 RepID=A0A6C2UDT5_PONDE|nr:hypothetical protein PDESU_06179 [Pontiella desulfatans]